MSEIANSNLSLDKLSYQSYKSKAEIEELYKLYCKGELLASPKEKLNINPKIAYVVTTDDIVKNIPFKWIKQESVKKVYGEVSRLSIQDPVSNLHWDYLYFVNTDVFRPAAIAFEKSLQSVRGTNLKPSYCAYLKGTTAYKNFWKEEYRRCKYGYEPIVDGKPCGIRIPGEFYFYLNYCVIKKMKELDNGRTVDLETFPDFLAIDYYYFKELEARERPELYNLPTEYKKSIVLAKGRRSGFSFKAASGCLWVVCFNKKARVGVASEPNSKDATDAVKCVRKCIPILDHLSNFTPFGRTEPGDPKKNGGWKHEVMQDTNEYVNITLGIFNTRTKEKKGRQSSIFTMSLSKDDAASGDGLNRLYFEEAGKTHNLDKAWTFSRETMKAGSLFRGIAIIFGTGGEMKSNSGKAGSSKAFSTLFYSPRGAELGSYKNIYEYKETPNDDCGFFVPALWASFGSHVFIDGVKYKALDNRGNAHFWVADIVINKQRFEKRPPAGDQEEYNRFLTQICKTPSEAFLTSSGNVFAGADLVALQADIKNSPGGYSKFRIAGELVDTGNKIIFQPDMDAKLQPITTMYADNSNKEGCLLIYEQPVYKGGKIPDNAYLISVDSIAINNSSGESYNSVHVMRTPLYSDIMGPEKIVATYFGRPYYNPLDFLYDLLYKLSIYYNAKITYENDRDGGIFNHFTKRGWLHMLCTYPNSVISKHIPNSKTLVRRFGHSMSSDKHKYIGELYLAEWLTEKIPGYTGIDRYNNVVTVDDRKHLHLLEDELTIEQLVDYNRTGNYDAVLSLMGAIVQFRDKFNFSSDEEYKMLYEDANKEVSDFYKSRYSDEYNYVNNY